ncbi:MAG TPA: hydroxyacylglutathione hydrolase [Burkholderiaceae bacterium]|nr:hydroxyacylglutathione hydrolase [Burkholderiaceae bacterium]
MVLVPIPAFTDNYIWVWHDNTSAVVVDPGETAGVVAYLNRHQLKLDAILVTHHHGDHTGGVAALQAATGATVYAPSTECPDLNAVRVTQGSHIPLLGTPCQVLHVPGHTAGHVAYVLTPPATPPVLFCGDTLFSAGCGRLFEGTPQQMLASLQALAQLPPDTLVCCTHEYTLGNIRFALAVEPGNVALQNRQAQCLALRAAQEPTLPSTLALEWQINPFLRVMEPAVRAAATTWRNSQLTQTGQLTSNELSDVEVLAALREWKNQF